MMVVMVDDNGHHQKYRSGCTRLLLRMTDCQSDALLMFSLTRTSVMGVLTEKAVEMMIRISMLAHKRTLHRLAGQIEDAYLAQYRRLTLMWRFYCPPDTLSTDALPEFRAC